MSEEVKEVKKRGRKKKEVTEEPETPETPSSSPEETVKEGKKRGRKPKATLEEVKAEKETENSPEELEKVEAAEKKTPEEDKEEENPKEKEPKEEKVSNEEALIKEILNMNVTDLKKMAKDYNIADFSVMTRYDLVNALLIEKGKEIGKTYGYGKLDIMGEGSFGFLRKTTIGPDVYVSISQIKRFFLRFFVLFSIPLASTRSILLTSSNISSLTILGIAPSTTDQSSLFRLRTFLLSPKPTVSHLFWIIIPLYCSFWTIAITSELSHI